LLQQQQQQLLLLMLLLEPLMTMMLLLMMMLHALQQSTCRLPTGEKRRATNALLLAIPPHVAPAPLSAWAAPMQPGVDGLIHSHVLWQGTAVAQARCSRLRLRQG